MPRWRIVTHTWPSTTNPRPFWSPEQAPASAPALPLLWHRVAPTLSSSHVAPTACHRVPPSSSAPLLAPSAAARLVEGCPAHLARGWGRARALVRARVQGLIDAEGG